MLKLIIGILLIVCTIIALIVSLRRTPENLTGYYGVMYWILSIIAVIGGVCLIIFR